MESQGKLKMLKGLKKKIREKLTEKKIKRKGQKGKDKTRTYSNSNGRKNWNIYKGKTLKL